MKDNLFEMLLNLFEKTLTQLKESHARGSMEKLAEKNAVHVAKNAVHAEFIKVAQSNSMRVFTYFEQMKLTKASYQFLMRMSALQIIPAELFELIINQLVFSDSRFVSLQETKWTIRNTLAEGLSGEQLAFLDLVLYQKEDDLPLH